MAKTTPYALFERAWDEFSTTESERLLAIVGCATVDDRLEASIRRRLRAKSRTVDKMFDTSGCLSDVSAKADLAYALELIDQPLFSTIEGIYRARNIFAHDLEASFSQSLKMPEALQKLTILNGRTHFPDPRAKADLLLPILKPQNQRETFLYSLRVCLLLLARISFGND